MESSVEDNKMMDEIISYLAESEKKRTTEKKANRVVSNSPFAKNLMKDLPPECFPDNDVVLTQKRREAKIRKAAQKKQKPTDPDELLNYYAAQLREGDKHGLSKEAVETKTLTLPFGDAMAKIDEYISLDKSLRTNKYSYKAYDTKYNKNTAAGSAIRPFQASSSMDTSSASVSKGYRNTTQQSPLRSSPLTSTAKGSTPSPSASIKVSVGEIPVLGEIPVHAGAKADMSRFHRKYPRLCHSFHFTDEDLLNVQRRSDFWITRFLEDCYDEAYSICNVPVCIESKWRLRNGLDLGSMESFPKVVERVLNVRYSVMEKRREFCMQFLCGLEQLVEISESARFSEVPENAKRAQDRGEDVYDGGRAQLFSSFLSEEYDLDFLALFLHVREAVQHQFQFRLRALNQSRIWLSTAEDSIYHRDTDMAKFTYYRVQQLGAAAGNTRRRGKRKLDAKQQEQQQQLTLKRQNSAASTIASAPSIRSSNDGDNKNRKRRNNFSDDSNSRVGGGGSNGNTISNNNRRKLSGNDSGGSSIKRSVSAAASIGLGESSNGKGSRMKNTTAAAGDEEEGEEDASISQIERDRQMEEEGAKKVVPVALPNKWHFMYDVTMPEAPLVGFDAALMSLVCLQILPQCPQAMRTYFTHQVTAAAKDALLDSAETLRNLVGAGSPGKKGGAEAGDASVISASGKVSVATLRASVAARKEIKMIPLYVLLRTLCVEWKKISLETKIHFIQSGAGSQSLRALNSIYENNSEMMRRMEEEVLATQKTLGTTNAKVMALEKTLRRLERKRVASIASREELVTLEETRNQLNDERMQRKELESRESDLIKRKQNFAEHIETLWQKATYGGIPAPSELEVEREKRKARVRAVRAGLSVSHDKRKEEEEQKAKKKAAAAAAGSGGGLVSKHSDWRKDVGRWLIKVIKTNLDEDNAIKMATLEKERQDKENALKEAAEQAAAAAAMKAEAERDPSTYPANHIRASASAQQYFVVEVMARLVTRTVLREGLRRVALEEYLRRQQHRLLLIYGSDEYKRRERDRILREQEEAERKRQYLLRVKAAKLMSGGIVDDSFFEAKTRAAAFLFDPWTLLDLHPSSWLPHSTLQLVDEKFALAKSSYELRCLRYLFHVIAREYRTRRLRMKMARRTCRIVLSVLHDRAMEAKTAYNSAVAIQKAIRAYVYRIRCQKHMDYLSLCMQRAKVHLLSHRKHQSMVMFDYWKNVAELAHRRKITVAALRERRLIVTFFTWMDQFKKHKYARMVLSAEQLAACLKLQCALRCARAHRRLLVLRARRRIGGLARRYLARLAVRRERNYVRLLADRAEGVGCIRDRFMLRTHFCEGWKLQNSIAFGVLHMQKAVNRDKMRRRFKKWLNYSTYRTKILMYNSTLAQSVIRMWMVHRYVLDYYRWRRGLLKLQGMCRRRWCMRRFVYDIYYYRAAKAIQRIFRGYRVRIHLDDARVADIHYASANNNYDRLKFYVDTYPHLVKVPDDQGNNALHNAARFAARRTIKLLMKHKMMDANEPNFYGYTPLHLTIMSTSAGRDECFLYMIERGFDDEVRGPEGKTTLLIAAEAGNTMIARHLLVEEDHNPNIPDVNGTTALQSACWQGLTVMVQDLIENEADVNMPGYDGTFPLHDCVYGGKIEIANMLVSHGAYVNVFEPNNYQTPLMWAASGGNGPMVRLYILQGAEVDAKDGQGRTAAHHAVASNSADIYNALREADADFDGQDSEGNTPLHLAAEAGAEEFAIHILHGGGFSSTQNIHGDQPAHLAARYNQLELLKQISIYDEHIGRVNYAHQTPLGVAKFYLAKECQEFLSHHYRLVEPDRDGRNKLGEVWWDKAIDDAVGDWEVNVNAAAERFYVNIKTGEVRTTPPTLSYEQAAETALQAELPLQRAVTIVKEENTLTKHAYYLDYAEKEKDVAELSKYMNNANIILKYARRKLAYMELQRLKDETRRRKMLTRFFRRHLPGFMRWKRAHYRYYATRIQACWRGYWFRVKFYDHPVGEYYYLRRQKAHWRLRYKLWAMWKFFLARREFRAMRMSKNVPVTLGDWQAIVDIAKKPIRRVGIFDEYQYPGARNIFFYRHALTGVCVFEKPDEMRRIDEAQKAQQREVDKLGATVRELYLITKVQAKWRGYMIRCYSQYVERAMEVSSTAEQKYLTEPNVDANVYNYALFCLVEMQDINRARHVFVECLRRMQWRGPDVPFVLYSYCIFALVARDEDYLDVMMLLTRARKAEEEIDAIHRSKLGGEDPEKKKAVQGEGDGEAASFRYGKSYDLANTGFFRHAAVSRNNAFAWECFAVCRFLVYRDFSGSFDAFMEAFRTAPDDEMLQENFNIMMKHFHGPSKEHRDAVVQQRQRFLAQQDVDRFEEARVRREKAQLREDSARRIQEWFKNQKRLRIYNEFMEGVRGILRRRRKIMSREATASRGALVHSHSRRSEF